MSAFLDRYLDSLTGASGPVSSPARERDGYSFAERYWASLTRTPLPSRIPSRLPRIVAAPAFSEHPSPAATLTIAAGPSLEGKPKGHDPRQHSGLTAGPTHAEKTKLHGVRRDSAVVRRRVAGLIAILIAVIFLSVMFAKGRIPGPVYWVLTVVLYGIALLQIIRSFGLLRHSIASMGILGVVVSFSLLAVAAADISSSVSSIGGSHAISASPHLDIPPSSDIFGSGKITSPKENFLPDAGKKLRVSGIVSGVPPGYHLALFVYSYVDDGGYAADIDVIVENKHWTGSIYPSQGFAAIVLAVLSPEGYKRLNGRGPSGPGLLKSLVSSRDAAVLDQHSIYAY